MDKVMEFLRDKFYYVVGVFGILVIVLIFVFSCSGGKEESDFEKIETNMVEAAREYYNDNKKDLPKEEGDMVSIKLSYLVNNGYIKEIKNPENKDKLCSGKVETIKRNNNYKYSAFLYCGNVYKTKLLSNATKSNLKLDSRGNGLYVVGDEYIFKGDDVNNYVSFDESLWRIIKIDKDGDVKIMLNSTNKNTYVWDDRYNLTSEGTDGINNFKMSRIRTTLLKYYKNNFNNIEGAKESIVKKEFCTGLRKPSDDLIGTAECSSTNLLYVGLIYVSEFYMATLDTTCTKFGQEQCANYNYLANNKNSSWTLTGSSETSYRVFSFYDNIYEVNAANDSRIYPVIYLDARTTISGGNGTKTNPYVVK